MEVKNSYAGVIIPQFCCSEDGYRFLVANHIKKTERPWRFPGGKIEGNELPIMTAARELQEELGIVANSLKLFNVESQHVDGKLWVGFYFLCGSYKGEPQIQEPEKLPEYRFATVPELIELGSHYEANMVKGL